MTEKELQLAARLLEAGTLTMRHVQLGMEWSARTGERLAKILSDMAGVPGDSLGKAADQLRSDGMEGTRRRFHRHVSDAELEILLAGQRAKVHLIDVSLGGMGFSTDIPVEVDSEVEIPYEDDRISGRIRHCSAGSDGSFAGVEFEPGSVEDLIRIERFLGSLRRD